MKLDAEALYSLCLQEPALEVARRTEGRHVLDAFCGVGGSAIAFARAGKRVTAIELNVRRLEMAKHNAELFGVAERIRFIHGDSLAFMPNTKADTLYFAPPWGGPSYTQAEQFTLSDFSPNGHQLMTLGLQSGANIVFQIPKNFDLDQFKQYEREFWIHRDVLRGELLSLTAFLPKKGGNPGMEDKSLRGRLFRGVK